MLILVPCTTKPHRPESLKPWCMWLGSHPAWEIQFDGLLEFELELKSSLSLSHTLSLSLSPPKLWRAWKEKEQWHHKHKIIYIYVCTYKRVTPGKATKETHTQPKEKKKKSLAKAKKKKWDEPYISEGEREETKRETGVMSMDWKDKSNNRNQSLIYIYKGGRGESTSHRSWKDLGIVAQIRVGDTPTKRPTTKICGIKDYINR